MIVIERRHRRCCCCCYFFMFARPEYKAPRKIRENYKRYLRSIYFFPLDMHLHEQLLRTVMKWTDNSEWLRVRVRARARPKLTSTARKLCVCVLIWLVWFFFYFLICFFISRELSEKHQTISVNEIQHWKLCTFICECALAHSHTHNLLMLFFFRLPSKTISLNINTHILRTGFGWPQAVRCVVF